MPVRLSLRLLAVIAIGVVPLIVVQSSAQTDAVLVPLVGSFALAAICTAVVAWLIALMISGVVVMVFYRTRPRAASTLVWPWALAIASIGWSLRPSSDRSKPPG